MDKPAQKIMLEEFNAMSSADAAAVLLRCCGAEKWCVALALLRPMGTVDQVYTGAERCFDTLDEADWLSAFAAHPKIGDLRSLRMKFEGNKDWSGGEQSGVNAADERTLERLAEGNAAYEARFGFIFIVCATGKSASQMLVLLEARLGNPREKEIPIASNEQRKITRLRLEKLFA